MVGVQRLCVKNTLGPECTKCLVDRVEKRNGTISEPCLEKTVSSGQNYLNVQKTGLELEEIKIIFFSLLLICSIRREL
jgi:hypothetical protein